jgi:hypothetical protein
MYFYFIYSTYSHKKGLTYLYDKMSFLYETRIIHIDDFTELDDVCPSCCIACLGGKDLQRLLSHLVKVQSKSKVFSLFPGVFHGSQLEALLSRRMVDCVLLNNKKDYLTYKFVCYLLGIKFNGLLLGVSWLKFGLIPKSSNEVVFFDQVYSPKRKSDRIELVRKLLVIAEKNPGYKVLIKAREDFKGHDLSIDNIIYKYFPNKSSILTDEKTDILLSRCYGVISISSSVIFEALVLKKNIFLLKDFKDSDYFSRIYSGSGLFVTSNDMIFSNPPDVSSKWYDMNISNPDDNFDSFKNFVFRKKEIFYKSSINRIRVYFLVCVFSILYRKNAYVLYKKIKPWI